MTSHDDDEPTSDELKDRLAEILRLNTVQLEATTQIRQELRAIGDRLTRGGFVLIPRPRDDERDSE